MCVCVCTCEQYNKIFSVTSCDIFSSRGEGENVAFSSMHIGKDHQMENILVANDNEMAPVQYVLVLYTKICKLLELSSHSAEVLREEELQITPVISTSAISL